MDTAAIPSLPPIRIPVVIGRNRLRGKSEGALVYDDFGGDHLSALRGALAAAARHEDVDPTPEYLTMVVGQMLKLYDGAYAAYRANPNGSIGFVWEARLPNGQILYMGDPRTLDVFRVVS